MEGPSAPIPTPQWVPHGPQFRAAAGNSGQAAQAPPDRRASSAFRAPLDGLRTVPGAVRARHTHSKRPWLRALPRRPRWTQARASSLSEHETARPAARTTAGAVAFLAGHATQKVSTGAALG
ncbi:hypothetical protein GCM10010357_63170 [Streptomyces luteireticuli]|uniref:Uncharacterized protein n=1 Tax=Streptomyces luteireticuli TaxID=173858 RepID=A0ABP3IYC2_9ACTN